MRRHSRRRRPRRGREHAEPRGHGGGRLHSGGQGVVQPAPALPQPSQHPLLPLVGHRSSTPSRGGCHKLRQYCLSLFARGQGPLAAVFGFDGLGIYRYSLSPLSFEVRFNINLERLKIINGNDLNIFIPLLTEPLEICIDSCENQRCVLGESNRGHFIGEKGQPVEVKLNEQR